MNSNRQMRQLYAYVANESSLKGCVGAHPFSKHRFYYKFATSEKIEWFVSGTLSLLVGYSDISMGHRHFDFTCKPAMNYQFNFYLLLSFHLSELTGQPIPIVIRISLLIKTYHPDQTNPIYYAQRRWFFSKSSWKKPVSLAKCLVWPASSYFWKAPYDRSNALLNILCNYKIFQ